MSKLIIISLLFLAACTPKAAKVAAFGMLGYMSAKHQEELCEQKAHFEGAKTGKPIIWKISSCNMDCIIGTPEEIAQYEKTCKDIRRQKRESEKTPANVFNP